MLQCYIGEFKTSEEINNKVFEIDSCIYKTVKDIRIICADRNYSMKVQILYEFNYQAYCDDNNITTG